MSEQQTIPVAQNQAIATKKDVVTIIAETQATIDKLTTAGQLQLPQNYSAGNALRALQLKIQDDSKLSSCTMASIAKTALKMVVLGLNPLKEQCYPIPYGNECGLFVSYFGNVAICKRIDPSIENIIARAVRKGENFIFKTNLDGTYTILEHKQTLESMDSKEFVAGYATIIYKDGKTVSHIMTMDKIKSSWKKSSVKVKYADDKGVQREKKVVDDEGSIAQGSTHEQYTEDMIQRTAINRICKFIKNTSDDKDLFRQHLDEMEVQELENEKNIANEIAEAETAQGEFIDIDESEGN